jgi:hypothetical protein
MLGIACLAAVEGVPASPGSVSLSDGGPIRAAIEGCLKEVELIVLALPPHDAQGHAEEAPHHDAFAAFTYWPLVGPTVALARGRKRQTATGGRGSRKWRDWRSSRMW